MFILWFYGCSTPLWHRHTYKHTYIHIHTNTIFIKYQRDATYSLYLVYFFNSTCFRISCISLVFYKTSITKMHGTMNIKHTNTFTDIEANLEYITKYRTGDIFILWENWFLYNTMRIWVGTAPSLRQLGCWLESRGSGYWWQKRARKVSLLQNILHGSGAQQFPA